jgi:hypothetical protein
LRLVESYDDAVTEREREREKKVQSERSRYAGANTPKPGELDLPSSSSEEL